MWEGIMRCNQIGRERIHGKLHLPGDLQYTEKNTNRHCKVERASGDLGGRWRLSQTTCSSLTKALCLLNKTEMPEMHWYNLAKEMKYFREIGILEWVCYTCLIRFPHNGHQEVLEDISFLRTLRWNFWVWKYGKLDALADPPTKHNW